MNNNIIEVFFALIRGGMWGQEVQLQQYGEIDFCELMNLAEEQSVVGLITAGLEHVTDMRIPQGTLLQFIGQTLQIEEQNKSMNAFVGELIEKMRKVGIYALLVKGQGIAQCYEQPLWRNSGDVDLYLSDENYNQAKSFLSQFTSHVDPENKRNLHFGMTIDNWVVELHGTMHEEFSKRMNRGLDEVHQRIFYGGEVRSWDNNGVTVFLPSADNDVIIVFTHFLQHFFIEGVGVRQICDWCRLLWRYRSELDVSLLEQRLRRMGLMTEWKAFASFAVNTLGMPKEVMPFCSKGYEKKAGRILRHILKTGNMGHNNDLSYRAKHGSLISGIITFYRRVCDFVKFTFIFPVDALRFFVTYVFSKVK